MSFCFEYKRIDLATDAIRLLQLSKGCRNDVIKCDLFESYLHLFDGGAGTKVSEAPADGAEGHVLMGEPVGVPYEALSYTWGNSIAGSRIWLGIYPVEVTENLYCALQNLRQTDQDRILWVDALCIDQKYNAVSGFPSDKIRARSPAANGRHLAGENASSWPDAPDLPECTECAHLAGA